MAKKKNAQVTEEQVTEEQVTEEQPTEQTQPWFPCVVSYDDLMTAKVRVVKDGVEAFYIDPARKLGEFILRPIPQTMEEAGEIPNEWRKPSKEEVAAADTKIDWEIPQVESGEVESGEIAEEGEEDAQ